jgi:heme exporter protein D
MLMLVTSDNLVQMFFGWEGVGLASYLLIGFWYKKPSRQRRGHQGVRRQPRRRFRLRARHLRPPSSCSAHRVRHHLSAAAPEQDTARP